MRRNFFNESYCHTLDEVEELLGRHGFSAREVYANPVQTEADETPCVEVVTNADGETLFFIEGPTAVVCAEIAKDAGIEVMA